MAIFEAIMLFCFGFSWPAALRKTVKTKNVTGQSIAFLWLVEIGYISGSIYKFSRDTVDWVAALYVINTGMVAAAIMLYYKYSRKPGDGSK